MRNKIFELLGLSDPDTLTASKGIFTLRREYYWRPKKEPLEAFTPTIEKLAAAGITIEVIETGDKWASFKGGQSVKKNSHYWMKFKTK